MILYELELELIQTQITKRGGMGEVLRSKTKEKKLVRGIFLGSQPGTLLKAKSSTKLFCRDGHSRAEGARSEVDAEGV